MRIYSTVSGIRSLIHNRALLRALVVRDIQSRYRGTVLGFVWTVAYPLMMLGVYTFVFGGIFNARWLNQGRMADFALMLYCGLIIYNVFSETLMRSPNALVSNPSYIKKVVFPLELLPICNLASAVFNGVVGVALLCFFLILTKHYVPVTAIITPIVFVPLLLLTAGMAWFLAAIGVFFRDVGQMIGVIMSVMLFLSPIFYPAAAAPKLAQKIIYLNPLTYPIEEMRNVLILGLLPNWTNWFIFLCVSFLIALFGLWTFQRTRPAFADVI